MRVKKQIEVKCIQCGAESTVEVDSALMEQAALNSLCQACWDQEVADKDEAGWNQEEVL